MQILLPMAGGRAHFSESDFFFPKPLVEVAGRPMIQRAVERLQRDFDSPDFIYVIDHEDAARFSLDSTLQFLSQGHCKIKKLQTKTQGALCTCLMAVDLLDLDEPLLIVNYDQVIDADLSGIVQRFQSEQAVAGVVTFDSIHPRWSYVRRDAQGQVVEAAEKRVISRDAIAGVYYFDTASRFVEIAKQTILNGDEVDGKYYIAPALNRLVVQNLSIAVQEISSKDYHTFYTPANVEAYAASVGKDGDVTDAQNIRSERLTVVIPAAGEGSRFSKAEWRKPKPFIDVGGKPMITRVIENVTPDGAVPTVLLRSQSIESYPDIVDAIRDAGARVRSVDHLTEGTACTVLLARTDFGSGPMMVANSDQLVDFDCADFVRDSRARGLDGSILVFRDKERNPKWSFAKLDDQGLVTEVAEKKPISDLATVGIYYFENGQDFVNATADMIALNDRVNNEFYTCPVYNYLIRSGKKIGVYEVGADAMHGLGTPEDMTAYLARMSYPPSQDSPEGAGS